MMTYTKTCPYCGNYIAGGHGDPIQKIGSPVLKCGKCGKPFIDSDIFEWHISPTYRKLGFYLANCRWALCVFPAIFVSSSMAKAFNNIGSLLFVLFFPTVFLFCAWLCSKYVKTEYAKQIRLSEERCKNSEYVQFLVHNGYPVDERYHQQDTQSSEMLNCEENSFSKPIDSEDVTSRGPVS